jgi:hypothetical protein
MASRDSDGVFAGKVVFITGAARGQGREHAIRFAEEGADVIAFDLCDQLDSVAYPMASPGDLEETVRLVEKTGRRIVAERGDVRDRDRLAAVVERGVGEFGRIDFVLANAGILPAAGAPGRDIGAYTDAVGVMLNGVYFTIDAALPVLEAAGGRAFLLCTTIRAVKHAALRLREHFEQRKLNFPLLVQGEGGRTELLERFRKLGNAVLVGSQSFWEGVDVRGESLSVVIIDKLPFAPPDDPVLAARIDLMEKRGLNGFLHHQLPEAIINLKQGAGRLIRDETDRGVLMICDPRLVGKPYGKAIWRALPPMRRTRDIAEVETFFAQTAVTEVAHD